MAYRQMATSTPGGFRPWNQRLSGYEKSGFVVPTATTAYAGAPVTGGLGLDLSSLTSSPVFWIAAAGAAYYFFFRKR